MTEVFEVVLRLSGYGLVAALVAALAVLLLSRTRCSKTVLLLLFAAVALRLVCPWSPPSPLSLFNWAPLDSYAQQQGAALADSYVGEYETAVDGAGSGDYDRALAAGVEPTYDQATEQWVVRYHKDEAGAITPAKTTWEVYGPILSGLWLAGAAGLFLYGAVSYILLKRRLRFAVKDEARPGVWYSDRIFSPCVAGLFRPQIYLTFGLTEEEKGYVLAHERQHIKNGDHIWKVLAWLIMCVHWFNVFLWPVFYRMFLWLTEEACDQRVLRQLGEDKKADYGQVLLSLSAGRRFRLSPSPIAFGEGDTKGRVKGILRYKKPIAAITALALVAAIVVGACLLTGPDRAQADGDEGEDPSAPVQTGDTAEGYGTYQIYDLLRLTPLSSIDERSYLDERLRTAVVFTPERFYLQMEDLDVDGPIYRAIAADSAPALATAQYLPEGVQGWEVLDADGRETGIHVYQQGYVLFVGSWVTHGTVSPMSEYWYLMEALLVGAGETLETTEVTWGVRLDDSGGSGFPLVFEGDFERIELSCDAGALTYDGLDAPGADLTVAGTPPWTAVEWLPVAEGQTEAASAAIITFTAWSDGEAALTGTITIRQTGLTNGLTTYAAYAALSDTDRYSLNQNFSASGTEDGAEISDSFSFLLADPLVTWSLDIDHDGEDETVSVYDYSLDEPGSGVFYLAVLDADGSLIGTDTAATTHAGQNGFYLYEEDGLPYLLRWQPYGNSGWYTWSYQIFSLSWANGKELTRQADTVDFVWDDPLSVDVAALRAMEDTINTLLPQCQVLLSTNYDTPDGVYYGDPEHPVVPELGSGYYSGSHETSDYYAQIQALAQGTYTFTAEVLYGHIDADGTGQSYLQVMDLSLFTEVADYQLVFTIPVDDPTQYQEGDTVSVTADGPLYRWDLPDEGTQGSVEMIASAADQAPSLIS